MKNKFKKIVGVSALGLLASIPAFAVQTGANSAGPVQLDLTGTVAASIAIDIDHGGIAVAGSVLGDVASANVGALNTSDIVSLKVASIGVRSNNGYLVSAYSLNGNLACSTPESCLGLSHDYQLAWESLSAMPIPNSVAQKVGLHSAVSQGSYECSLLADCPGTPDDRHDIMFSAVANPSLAAGTYSESVYFVVEDASLL